MTNFESFGLPEALIHTLTRIGYTIPTPIQEQAIPLAMEGRDVLGSAQTGTGKTAAFSIPMIAKLKADENAMGLILTPTRELAVQVETVIRSFLPKTSKIKTALLIGGEKIFKQYGMLKQNPRIIVGTPGRINDHLTRKTLRLDKVNFLVLDETDRMLDMGFGVQIDKILKFVPDERQTMLFSATMPPNIVKLANKYQNNPARVAVGSVTTPIANIKQETIKVSDANKYDVLLDELHKRSGTVIVFVRTRRGADRLSLKLAKDGHSTECLHGDLQHKKRERVINAYRDQQFRILVATDVAARGLDIPHIEHVINYDLPQQADDYIHRIGRTARAGAEGSALCLISPSETGLWRAIDKLINKGEHTAAEPYKPKKSSGGFGGGRSDRNGFGGGGRDRDRGGFGGEKRNYGPKKFGDKPAFRKKFDNDAGESFGEKKSFSDRPFREKKFGDKPFGDKPGFKKKFDNEGGERKTFGERKFGPKKFGDKPFGERKSFGDKPAFRKKFDNDSGERKSFDDKPFGERKSFGDKPAFKKKFDNAGGERKSFGDKPFGERKTFGDKPSFGGKKFGPKKFGEVGNRPASGGRPSFGAKPFGAKPPFKKKWEGEAGSEAKDPNFKPYRRKAKIKSI